MREKIGDLAELWYRKGFNRGHIESHAAFEKDGSVPLTLEFPCKRTLSPGQRRDLILESTIKKKIKKKPKKLSKNAARKKAP